MKSAAADEIRRTRPKIPIRPVGRGAKRVPDIPAYSDLTVKSRAQPAAPESTSPASASA
jgi:hypothetical protein